VSRIATGNPRLFADGWVARVKLPGATEEIRVSLPHVKRDDKAGAAREARRAYDKCLSGGAVSLVTGETVAEYSKRWIQSREGKIASNADCLGHLKNHILPVLGLLEMTAVDKVRDIERLIDVLDAKVEAEEISSKTAVNVWMTAGKMFDDATNAKIATGLRCLAADPCDGVRGPDDTSADKMLQFLYPEELLQFLNCAEVPIEWRVAVAIAVYLCLRDGEQRALRWEHLDLEHQVATIAEVVDRKTGKTRAGTKNGEGRVVSIPEPLMPLLRSMREAAGGEGKVCRMALSNAARGLRLWLARAGVGQKPERAKLVKGSETSKVIRWHDLRATGLTWHAVAGKPATEIRDIAGHKNTTMTDRYLRAASVVRAGRHGEVFPALPECLNAKGPAIGPGLYKFANSSNDTKWSRRGSNP
jgi:integrase